MVPVELVFTKTMSSTYSSDTFLMELGFTLDSETPPRIIGNTLFFNYINVRSIKFWQAR